MKLHNSKESGLNKIIFALLIVILTAACDSGGGGDGGDADGGQQPANVVSACDGFIPTMTGTSGDDVLTGTPGNDIIVGLAGDDTIDGLGGNDRICGDAGNDNLLGGNGNDVLDGGPDDDTVDGEDGDDIIIEDPGSSDILTGPPPGPFGDPFKPTQDEISFTNADESIFLNMTTAQEQPVNNDGDTIMLVGFFPNIYGSFNPDTFLFSNSETFNGATGHLFDPSQGAGTDIFIVDAQGHPASVIEETSFFEVGGGGQTLQSDRTIIVGDTLYNTIGIESIELRNFQPIIMDNSVAEFSTPGLTLISDGRGFGGDIAFIGPGELNTATYTFMDIPNSTYLVSTTYTSTTDGATNTPYAITSGSDTRTVVVNQAKAPDNFIADGAFWTELQIIEVKNNTLTVTVMGDADGFVIADAVRIEPMKIEDKLLIDNVRGLPPGGGSVSRDTDSVGVELVVEGGIARVYGLENASSVTLIEFGGSTFDGMEQLMRESNTDLLLITTTYPPRSDVSDQVKFTLNINGNLFETVFDQTQTGASFTDAPLGQNGFHNLFLCRLPDDDNDPLTPPKVNFFNGHFESITDTQYIWDALAVVPVNRLELPRFGVNPDGLAALDGNGDDVRCLAGSELSW